jgi:putative oxidoreductase
MRSNGHPSVGANRSNRPGRRETVLESATAPHVERAPRRWRRLEAFDRSTREFLARVSPVMLRISLGIVFVWFGLLKVANASAVGGLVASTVPFLDSSWFVPALGALEVVIGLAFASGKFVRAVLPVFALHLAGTFLVLVLLPEVAFEQDNPVMLTVVGEFVVKNLVLLSAGLVVASGTGVRRSNRVAYADAK